MLKCYIHYRKTTAFISKIMKWVTFWPPLPNPILTLPWTWPLCNHSEKWLYDISSLQCRNPVSARTKQPQPNAILCIVFVVSIFAWEISPLLRFLRNQTVASIRNRYKIYIHHTCLRVGVCCMGGSVIELQRVYVIENMLHWCGGVRGGARKCVEARFYHFRFLPAFTARRGICFGLQPEFDLSVASLLN